MFIQTQIYKENEEIKVTHDDDLAIIELMIRNALFVSLSKEEARTLATKLEEEIRRL